MQSMTLCYTGDQLSGYVDIGIFNTIYVHPYKNHIFLKSDVIVKITSYVKSFFLDLKFKLNVYKCERLMYKNQFQIRWNYHFTCEIY